MQGVWNKLFTIWCESYQVGVSHVTSFCKTATELHILKALARTHTQTHTPTLLFNCYWPTFPHDISVTNIALTCAIPAYKTRQNSQIYPLKGVKMEVNARIRRRGATTFTTDTILHSNIPTVTHNSKHYSVQITCRCNTPRFISSLLIELPRQSVATNTDFSSGFFMPCFAADIPLVVQTNFYYQL